MLSTRRFRPVGFGRAAPPRRRAGPLALLALALAALAVEGCSSCGDPCRPGPLAGLGSFRPFSRCRLFRRDVIVADPCGEPALGVPVEGAAAEGAAVIAAPSCNGSAPAATGVAPGPPVELEPVTPAPADELAPAPAPSTIPAPKSGQSSPAQKTLYETAKPTGGTTTSRRAGARGRPGERTGSGPSDLALSAPLVDLPPVTAAVAAPTDDETASPVAPPAAGAPTVAPKPTTPTIPKPAAPAAPTTPKPATPADAAAGATPAVPGELPPKPARSGPVSVAEGIARFKAVAPQLAAGGLPTEAGWKFLAEEKGYRTVLDLRPRAEVQPGDDALIHHYGLRYVVLPLTPETLDETLLKSFEDEIQLAGARPLFFFDQTGERPAILWYLHQVLVGNQDEATARSEVEDLGPIDSKLWLAATALVQRRKAPAAGAPAQPAPAQVPAGSPKPEPAPSARSRPTLELEPTPELAPSAASAAPEARGEPGPGPEPARHAAEPAPVAAEPAPDPADSRDPGAWKPYAAMAVASLGIPLAYIGRTAISSRGLGWASLPAPRHGSRALPGGSGE